MGVRVLPNCSIVIYSVKLRQVLTYSENLGNSNPFNGTTCKWNLFPWWRHQMEAFSALLAICAGNSQVTGEFPTQRPVTRSFGVCFDLWPNKRLSKQSWSWWFETLSRPLWRHCNGITGYLWCSHWWILSFGVACVVTVKGLLNKQSSYRWFWVSWIHI